MSLEIDQPLIVATSQTIVFSDLQIQNDANLGLIAVIRFVVKDDQGNQVDTKTIRYSGEEYNMFWNNFNSGKFLYEQLVTKDTLPVSVPDSVENDFLNAV